MIMNKMKKYFCVLSKLTRVHKTFILSVKNIKI